MEKGTVRAWFLVHKWTSIICTLFMLMLCLTGLPLIFNHEIDEMSRGADNLPPLSADMQLKTLDEIMNNARAKRAGDVGLYMSFDEERPIVYVTTGPRPDAEEPEMNFAPYDWRTGQEIPTPTAGAIVTFLLELHTDMFLGLPGMLFLGFMGFLMFVATVSGVVLYAPFMRKLDFGTLRTSRSTRLKWLDYHNFLGILLLAWLSVVGLTGVINTLNDPLAEAWQADEIRDMTAAHGDAPRPETLSSIQGALDTALAAGGGVKPVFIAFPGTLFSSTHHYAVYLEGKTPITQALLTPALVDAADGTLTDMRTMPWYMQTLLMSRPLHFGDYGGLPLKILWAVLDIFTIIVLGSGLYLWLGKKAGAPDRTSRRTKLATEGNA
ncbi:MAG: PepSY domain-containing protein [Alphaproteobacteria bacterium]|nr:MAG: PepSY domain-containing protein [Alphaproteobacteria bacterium]